MKTATMRTSAAAGIVALASVRGAVGAAGETRAAAVRRPGLRGAGDGGPSSKRRRREEEDEHGRRRASDSLSMFGVLSERTQTEGRISATGAPASALGSAAPTWSPTVFPRGTIDGADGGTSGGAPLSALEILAARAAGVAGALPSSAGPNEEGDVGGPSSSYPTWSPSLLGEETAWPAMDSAAGGEAPSLPGSAEPSLERSGIPSLATSSAPSAARSASPSVDKSSSPSVAGSGLPSVAASDVPSTSQSDEPSSARSQAPSAMPIIKWSAGPSVDKSSSPSVAGSGLPSVSTSYPTWSPTLEEDETAEWPTFLTNALLGDRGSSGDDVSSPPSGTPGVAESDVPSEGENDGRPLSSTTSYPTRSPSLLKEEEATAEWPTFLSNALKGDRGSPSAAESGSPSVTVSVRPSVAESDEPSAVRSQAPSVAETVQPTDGPARPPTERPTALLASSMEQYLSSSVASPGPTAEPTRNPTRPPTRPPTTPPTRFPTRQPTRPPTRPPSSFPTAAPTAESRTFFTRVKNFFGWG